MKRQFHKLPRHVQDAIAFAKSNQGNAPSFIWLSDNVGEPISEDYQEKTVGVMLYDLMLRENARWANFYRQSGDELVLISMTPTTLWRLVKTVGEEWVINSVTPNPIAAFKSTERLRDAVSQEIKEAVKKFSPISADERTRYGVLVGTMTALSELLAEYCVADEQESEELSLTFLSRFVPVFKENLSNVGKLPDWCN